MAQKSIILHFNNRLVDKPIVSHLVKAYDIDLNILHARITPEEDGTMFLIMEGEAERIESGIKYLEGLGVKTLLPSKNLIWKEERCVHCGACVGQCLPKALDVEAATRRVKYDGAACIACELCVAACPYGAIESVSKHLSAEGGHGNGQNNQRD